MRINVDHVHIQNGGKQGTGLNLVNELEAVDSLLQAPGGHVKARLRRIGISNAGPIPAIPGQRSVTAQHHVYTVGTRLQPPGVGQPEI